MLQKMYLDGRVRGRGRERSVGLLRSRMQRSRVHIRRRMLTTSRPLFVSSAPYVDTFPRSAALTSSTVPTSIPPTPSHMMHDRELSPTPMSPSLSGGPHHRSLRGAPSADPLLFTVCVGVKPSSAQYYVNDVEGVLRSLYGLVLRDYEDRPPSAVSPSSGETSPRFGLTKRGPGASSGVRRGSTDASSSGGGGMGPKRSSFATLLFGNKAVESKE